MQGCHCRFLHGGWNLAVQQHDETTTLFHCDLLHVYLAFFHCLVSSMIQYHHHAINMDTLREWHILHCIKLDNIIIITVQIIQCWTVVRETLQPWPPYYLATSVSLFKFATLVTSGTLVTLTPLITYATLVTSKQLVNCSEMKLMQHSLKPLSLTMVDSTSAFFVCIIFTFWVFPIPNI